MHYVRGCVDRGGLCESVSIEEWCVGVCVCRQGRVVWVVVWLRACCGVFVGLGVGWGGVVWGVVWGCGWVGVCVGLWVCLCGSVHGEVVDFSRQFLLELL